MTEQLGAGLEQWHHWSITLGLAEHLLPVVVNPDAPISPDSNMKALGKTPSRYNYKHEVSGFAKWTDHRATLKEIGKWELEEDYGICMQSREGGLRAIDIDVPGTKRSRKIVEHIEGHFPHLKFYRRSRERTGKVLLPFRLEGLLTKRVLKVNGGIIEVLGDGQQWIAEGAYVKDGKVDGRYLWPAGRPEVIEDVPVLTMEQLEDLCEVLAMLFEEGDDGWSIARERRTGLGEYKGPPRDDEIGAWLIENWEITGDKGDGTLFVRCPWIDGHSGDSGPSETQYALPGNGFGRGHFKCLHASCQQRTDGEFLEEMGFKHDLSDAPDLPDVDAGKRDSLDLALPRRGQREAPKFLLNRSGRKESRVYNHELFLQCSELCGIQIAWDNFTAAIVWSSAGDAVGEEHWKSFSDEHYARIVRQMDRNGFVAQAASSIRPAVYSVARQRPIDTAIEWARRLPEWDGISRIETFLPTYFKTEDRHYTRSVSRYMWTAQAGRLLDPGCQADMVPIFVSAQGTRKTSAIRALAPSITMFTDVNLLDRDDNTIRKMRGKLVLELDELRGLRGRAAEDVKSFITRREEEWVPKYQEFTKTFKRRFVMYGSTNDDDFLGDPTGERRYLPVEVGVAAQIDVEAIERDRLQLWGEAIFLWQRDGIAWEEAQRLAIKEHERFKSCDEWIPLVAEWALCPGGLSDPHASPCDMPYKWRISDALAGAVNISRATKADEMRMSKVLTAMGAVKRKTNGYSQWHLDRFSAHSRISPNADG
ncbi:virulence-associated E family protein [Tsuneonella troitsensis]|uniref:virulence-associated E family protein n=1 Tax=Tsuneonella troitsensis TaxID=292222 RepID=UPI00070B4164|nr:virulence-associated E family protein [Tsuneonella troitsensis]